MKWRISVLIIFVLFASCKKNHSKTIIEESTVPKESYASVERLIEVVELHKIVNSESIKIIDFRKPESFKKDHIKGAINIWRKDVEDRSYPYNGMLASKDQIESLFSKLGIKNSDTLIIYDDDGACNAARLWWVLQCYNFNNVKLLNGGFPNWKAHNYESTVAITNYEPSHFKLIDGLGSSLFLDLETLKDTNFKKDSIILLDTRTDDEYSGKRQKNGAKRAGKIPNSILFDWANAVNYNGDFTFKSYNELMEMYNLKGLSKDKTIYVYCHSGVRSAHTTFVLTELLGYENVKNYDGSWLEWSFYDDLPIEKDSITSIY